jgi:GDPmannose 4,6-dehydratase
MTKKNILIIGGTGQFGITMSQILIKKKFNVFATSRFSKKINSLRKIYPKVNYVKLNILNPKNLEKILRKIDPSIIFNFAGQSSPQKSFKKKIETYKSNFEGCKNIIEILHKNNFKNIKFINATSSEMYGNINSKINLNTKKKPLNPYGKAKKKSFNLVKKYRDKFNMKNYNAIIFNTESFYRKENIIAKVCIGAIKAHKYNMKLTLDRVNFSREWNWCDEQCQLLIKFLKKKPQDFILSNGKDFSIETMLNYAFKFFNLNYTDYLKIKFKKLNKIEINNKKSNYRKYINKNRIKFNSKIFGKKLVYKMINYYLKQNKI